MLEQIVGKKSHDLSALALKQKLGIYNAVVIDLGCGDGMLPYRLAKQNPETFYIGIDAARESLAKASAKAAKKPARGGCPNVLFLCANLLDPLPELVGVADELQWNFPWGSLMHALVAPDISALKTMATLAKNKATFKLFLNLYVFENEDQRQDMGLPEMTDSYVQTTLVPAMAQAGLVVTHHAFFAPQALKNHPSTWAGRLIRRSGRHTLYMEGAVHHGG